MKSFDVFCGPNKEPQVRMLSWKQGSGCHDASQ